MDATIIVILLICSILIVFVFAIKQKQNNLTDDFINKVIIEIKRIKKEKNQNQKIMEYDKIVYKILKQRKVNGKTLGEKMKNGKILFLNNNNLWKAHKMRNKIAHEINFSTKNNKYIKMEKIFLNEILNLLKK